MSQSVFPLLLFFQLTVVTPVTSAGRFDLSTGSLSDLAGGGGSVGAPGVGGGVSGGANAGTYFPDWSTLSGRPAQPTCMDIPPNMTLCHDIGYKKMRLPNLLDHDTMAEVTSQSASWVPLLNIKCHADTRLFLCSLFSPVCLDRVDRPIYPCRSLCEAVKAGCEGRMKTYGFPWPDMLRCEKFPVDNDMCITAQSSNDHDNGGACSACKQPQTYENIMDNFCRADFAVKTKIRKIKKSRIICKKSKVFKPGASDVNKNDMKSIRRPKFMLDNIDECCGDMSKKIRAYYLIMGNKEGENLVPKFIMEWSRDSIPFKKAIKRFRTLDCNDPKMVSKSMVADGAIRMDSPFTVEGSDKEKSTDGPNRRTRKVRGRRKETNIRLNSTTTIEPADS